MCYTLLIQVQVDDLTWKLLRLGYLDMLLFECSTTMCFQFSVLYGQCFFSPLVMKSLSGQFSQLCSNLKSLQNSSSKVLLEGNFDILFSCPFVVIF